MTCHRPGLLAGVSRRETARWACLFAVFALAWGVLPQTTQAQSVEAQTAAERQAGEPYFHEAAQFYVAKQKRQALRVIEDGLDVAPNHPKLLALKNRLENQPSARSDQNPGESETQGPEQQENAEPQDGDSGQEGETEAPQQGNQPSPGRAGESGNQGAPQPPEPNNSDGERQGDGQQERPGEEGETSPDGQSGGNESSGRPSGESTERLSREQAERILKALEGQEKQLLREVQKREARPRRVEKDW